MRSAPREEHPPGFYGPADAPLAVNALAPGDRLAPLDFAPLNARVAPLAGAETVDLRAPLSHPRAAAASQSIRSPRCGSSGHLGTLGARLRRAGAAAAVFMLCSGEASRAPEAHAQERPLPPIAREDIEAALATHLAYVITGDAQVDATSKAGLTGLTQMLASRTALEPGEPVGVDLARDELAFYPAALLADRRRPASAERGRASAVSTPS